MQNSDKNVVSIPWNKGKLVGQKHPLKLKELWEIRIRLELAEDKRGLALFNLAIYSKLRDWDLVKLKVSDVVQANRVKSMAIIMQQKTHRPVQFDITEHTRVSLEDWIKSANLKSDLYLFTSRLHWSQHLSTRQYGSLVEKWVKSIGLDPAGYGTHSMRRTKATLICRKTKNLRAVQLLLGHSKLESTVRY